MDIIKDIGKSLNFKERYDDLERTGMEEYDRKECKELRELSKSGAPLSESQKETLHYCDTIRGERQRMAMNLGTSAAKVTAGAIMGNPQLAMQGLTDAGGYVMSEAQEVDGPNDGVGQKIGKEDYMKLGTDIVSGVAAGVMGGQGAEGAGGGNDEITKLLTGSGGDGSGGETSSTSDLLKLLQNPDIVKLLQQMQAQQQNPAGQTTAADTLAALAARNTNGSKLKRSTREHDYIKGNTRGYQ